MLNDSGGSHSRKSAINLQGVFKAADCSPFASISMTTVQGGLSSGG